MLPSPQPSVQNVQQATVHASPQPAQPAASPLSALPSSSIASAAAGTPGPLTATQQQFFTTPVGMRPSFKAMAYSNSASTQREQAALSQLGWDQPSNSPTTNASQHKATREDRDTSTHTGPVEEISTTAQAMQPAPPKRSKAGLKDDADEQQLYSALKAVSSTAALKLPDVPAGSFKALDDDFALSINEALKKHVEQTRREWLVGVLKQMGWDGSQCKLCEVIIMNGQKHCPACLGVAQEQYARFKRPLNPFIKK
jgi:hypothetical protein